ncbi:MAG: hypothetical protein KUG77_17965, partial [Nannocystaceae bacterium]|nr:hypothetical protein [Nannocystaceae bacterium]
VPGGWMAPTPRFADLFSASITDIAPGVLPDFQYAFEDLERSCDADLRARTLANVARLSLWLLRDARTATLSCGASRRGRQTSNTSRKQTEAKTCSLCFCVTSRRPHATCNPLPRP